MQTDDETSAYQLHRLLRSRGYNISLSTILRCRKALGWTFCGSAYCQLIRNANKEKRLDWARQNVNLSFDNVVWSDECTVQLESHRRYCCRKKGHPAKNKPRYGSTRIHASRAHTHTHIYIYIYRLVNLCSIQPHPQRACRCVVDTFYSCC